MAGPQVQRPQSAYYTGLNGSSNGHQNGSGSGGGGGLTTSTSHHTGLHVIRTISHDSELIYRGSNGNTHITNNSTASVQDTCTASTSRSIIQQQPTLLHHGGRTNDGSGGSVRGSVGSVNLPTIAGTGHNPNDALIVPAAALSVASSQQQQQQHHQQHHPLNISSHSLKASSKCNQRSIEIIVDPEKCDAKDDEDDVEQGKTRRSSRHRHRPLHRRFLSYLKSLFHSSTAQTGEDAKKRWKNIRDSYKRYKNKENLTSGSESTFRKPYKYAECLRFLDDVPAERRTICNVSECSMESIDLSSDSELYETPSKKKKNYDQLQNQMSDFLNSATNSIQSIVSGLKTNSTALLFESLSNKIQEANLSKQEINDIEVAVCTLVYSKLDSELEEFETPARYRPDSLSALCRVTRFTEDEIKRIYRGFKAECPTGVVKEDTFKLIYSQFFPQGGSCANPTLYAHYVFNTLDQDHTGIVSFEDFVQGLSILSRGSVEEKLRWTFQLYDINGDGYITREEMTDIVTAIYELMGRLPDELPEEEKIKGKVEQIFQKMDINRDGVVTLEEFLEACHNDDAISRSMSVFDSAF